MPFFFGGTCSHIRFWGVLRSMLVILSGLPGSGKTTIARELVRQLSAVYVRIDSVEQAIRDSGIDDRTMYDAGYRVGYRIAEDNLLSGSTVVADSVNPIRASRDAWRDAARRAKSRFLEIEIVCSDVKEHRRRIESRLPDIPGAKLPTWPDVTSLAYEPWSQGRLVIDTAVHDVLQSVRLVRDAMAAQRE